MPDIDDERREAHQELTLLYEVTVGDLAYFKTQQWAVTNHSFLLFAGIVTVRQLVTPMSGLEKMVLLALAGIIVTAAWIILSKLQESIEVREFRLDAMRQSFSPIFQTTWAAKTKDPEYVHAISFLRAALVLGSIIVAWLVIRSTA